jgi:hypothetical protein
MSSGGTVQGAKQKKYCRKPFELTKQHCLDPSSGSPGRRLSKADECHPAA